MANEEHLAILRKGVEAWNKWREVEEIQPTLPGADLNGTNLTDFNFRGAYLVGANFSDANLRGANFTGAYLSDASLTRANFTGTNLRDTDLTGTNLKDADLTGAFFQSTNLHGAFLEGADLSDTELGDTNFEDAKLGRAKLSGSFLLGTSLHKAQLSGADLSSAILMRANLTNANLFGANLKHATLCDTILRETVLSESDLRNSHLDHTDISDANLSGANLSGAQLNSTVLNNSVFSNAVLEDALLDGTVFGNTDLSGAMGLDKCRFSGPCIIDHRTIERSGQLPLVFLRGCGLPDMLIDYLPSLLNQPIQYYSCFISYSGKDDEFARRIHADLQNNGVRCWFAPHDIAGGKKIHEQIEEAIRRYERLLLILSEHSMESDWVATEIANAREREASEERQVLFPIRLMDYERIKAWKCFDADRGKDSAKEIREYFIPNFTNWKDHDAYTESFERLLKDLKAETTSSGSE